jgi:alpha-tubulin suppressor-like RCC1 family protein
MYVWGKNVYGQLGIETSRLYLATPNLHPRLFGLNFVKLALGDRRTFLLDIFGDISTWGQNTNQVGLCINSTLTNSTIPIKIPFTQKVHDISAGTHHLLIRDSNNDVWACGDNAFGQLGTGDSESTSIPTLIALRNKVSLMAAGRYHSLLYTELGFVYGFGRNSEGQLGCGDK